MDGLRHRQISAAALLAAFLGVVAQGCAHSQAQLKPNADATLPQSVSAAVPKPPKERQQPPPETGVTVSQEVRFVSAVAPEPAEQIPPSPETRMTAPQELQESLGLPDLLRISLERNPELRQANLQVQAASGHAVQAGLYPNPTVIAEGSELGNRNGPGGFITAPLVSQEVVTGGKLRLSRQVGEKEVDQARLQVLGQRFALYTAVRRGYFDVLAAQRRIEIYSELVGLASKATETTETLVKGRQAAPLDLIQIRVEMNRFRAELDAARQERTMKHAVKHIHFVGVGGAGMSGIAEILHNLGYRVSGSDQADSPTARRLAELGIRVFVGHDAAHIAGAQAGADGAKAGEQKTDDKNGKKDEPIEGEFEEKK